MRLEEMTIIRVTMAPKKRRKEPSFWDLDQHPDIKAAIEKCQLTQEDQYVLKRGEMLLYHIRPGFPLIDEAMARPENKSLVRVSVSLYTAAIHLGVRNSELPTDKEKA